MIGLGLSLPRPVASAKGFAPSPETASHAWSVARKLRPAFAGAPIRVRRSSDSTEQDIAFTAGGILDTAALLTFCGAGDGFLTKVYDQGVDTAADLVQATASAQYRIVNAGVLVTMNGKPCGEIYQASQGMRFTLGAAFTGDAFMCLHTGLGSSAVSSSARLFSLFSATVADGSGTGSVACCSMNAPQAGGNDGVRSTRSGSTLGTWVVPPAAANVYGISFTGALCHRFVGNAAGGNAAMANHVSSGAFAWDRGGWSVTSNASFFSHIGCKAGETLIWTGAFHRNRLVAEVNAAKAFWAI